MEKTYAKIWQMCVDKPHVLIAYNFLKLVRMIFVRFDPATELISHFTIDIPFAEDHISLWWPLSMISPPGVHTGVSAQKKARQQSFKSCWLPSLGAGAIQLSHLVCGWLPFWPHLFLLPRANSAKTAGPTVATKEALKDFLNNYIIFTENIF